VTPAAPLRLRLASLFYELLLTAAVLFFGFFTPQALLGALGARVPPVLLWVHIYLLLGLYFGWQWSRGRRTLAMKTWHLHLETEDGCALTSGHALLRYFWSWPSVLLGGVGLWWALVDRDGRFLHDRLAHTRLVRDPA
jgi:uncharacterized RDD family membrane protein YckC